MSEIIKVCLIGTGRAGMIHGRNFARSIENGKLVGICDPAAASLEKAQAELHCEYVYSDYKEVMANPDIDAVIIVTPTVYHKEIAIAAAKAGKHILCEKPLAMDELECLAIIEAAEFYHVKLQVGFMRRFDASFQEAKKVIESGAIGEVVLIKSLTHGPSEPKAWMFDIRKSNGPIGEVNSHDFDMLRWLTGREITSIYAIGGNYRSPEVKEEFPDYYDTVAMNVCFDDGKIGMVDGAQYVQYGYDARAEILGTKGSILVGDQGKHNITVATNDGKITRPTMHSWMYLFREAYLAEDKSFIECILEDKNPVCTGKDGLMAVKLVNAGLTSLLEKRIVKVEI